MQSTKQQQLPPDMPTSSSPNIINTIDHKHQDSELVEGSWQIIPIKPEIYNGIKELNNQTQYLFKFITLIQIKGYLQKSDISDAIEFPKTLNGEFREQLHRYAEQFNLLHCSIGKGKNRRMRIGRNLQVEYIEEGIVKRIEQEIQGLESKLREVGVQKLEQQFEDLGLVHKQKGEINEGELKSKNQIACNQNQIKLDQGDSLKQKTEHKRKIIKLSENGQAKMIEINEEEYRRMKEQEEKNRGSDGYQSAEQQDECQKPTPQTFQDVPDPISNVQIINISGTQVQITWKQPNCNNSEISSFKVYLNEQQVDEVNDAYTFLQKLSPETIYKLTIRAINKMGQGYSPSQQDSFYFQTMSHTQPSLVQKKNQVEEAKLQEEEKQQQHEIQFRSQKLYGWGSNKSQSLLLLQDDINFLQCYDSKNQSVSLPYHSLSFQQVDIIDISSHFNTSTVLDAENQIIEFGNILPDFSEYMSKQKIEPPLFRLIQIPQNLSYKHIVTKVASGDSFTVALTVLGQLFTWGSNGHGELGIDEPSTLISHSPINISNKGDLKKQFIQDISCSFNSAIALTRKGQIIGWGYQAIIIQPGYSIKNSEFQVNKPAKLKFIDDKVVQISSGRLHHCFVTANGNCHTFGSNRYWQLGYDQQIEGDISESNFYGRKLQLNFEGNQWKCKSCVCGLDFCIALIYKQNGQERLIGWGRNKRGQCGVGKKLKQRIKPQFCKFQGVSEQLRITQISAGEKHTLLLDDKNQIWVCGSTRNGRIYVKAPEGIVCEFQKIQSFPLEGERVQKIVAGESHSFAVCSKQLN